MPAAGTTCWTSVNLQAVEQRGYGSSSGVTIPSLQGQIHIKTGVSVTSERNLNMLRFDFHAWKKVMLNHTYSAKLVLGVGEPLL